jgi:hypothetical protein
MSSLFLKAVLSVLLKRAAKSVTSWLAVVAAGGATTLALDPQLLAYIPHGALPYLVVAYGVLVVLARHREEITAVYGALQAKQNIPVADILKLYGELKSELPAAVTAAKAEAPKS